MNRQRVGSVFQVLAILGFWLTAWLHSTGLDSIRRAAAGAPDDLRALAPALWLFFSLDYVIFGVVLLLILVRRAESPRPLIAAIGIAPFGHVWLQVTSIGFVPPSALLLAVGTLTLVAALVLPSAERRPKSA